MKRLEKISKASATISLVYDRLELLGCTEHFTIYDVKSLQECFILSVNYSKGRYTYTNMDSIISIICSWVEQVVNCYTELEIKDLEFKLGKDQEDVEALLELAAEIYKLFNKFSNRAVCIDYVCKLASASFEFKNQVLNYAKR